jgi:hypothetical protein
MAVHENTEDGGPETPPWANLGAGLITGAARRSQRHRHLLAGGRSVRLRHAVVRVPDHAADDRDDADGLAHRRVMGEFTMPWPLKLFGWLATAAMATAVVAMFVMWGK